MSNQSGLSLQWSLNETSSTGLTVARGLIKAATSDNIQPLTLMACEQFGTTIPMITETRLKMETIARKKDSKLLGFIKCQVGYSEGDTADYLSRTDSGVRFLGFAATLYSIRSSISAARVLEDILRESARDDQVMPTLLQFKGLLDVLESKLALSDFANSVQGWATVCSSMAVDKSPELLCYRAPSHAKIKDLMRALNQCICVRKDCTMLIESAYVYFPWTIAFLKWFTGTPPTVSTPKKVFFDAPDSFVEVREINQQNINNCPPFPFYISLITKLDNIKTLIDHDNNTSFEALGGLVDVDVWMRNRIARYQRRVNTSPEFAVLLHKTLWFIIKYFPEKLLLTANSKVVDKFSKKDQPEPNPHRAYPFPVSTTRLEIAQYLLQGCLLLPQGEFDHAQWLDEVQKACNECHWCHPPAKTIPRGSAPCFKDFAGDIAADLLVLSLIISDTHLSHRPKVQLDAADLQILDYRRLTYGIEPLSDTQATFSSMYTDSCGGMCCRDYLNWTGVVQRGWWSLTSPDLDNPHITYKAEGLFHHLLHLLGHETLATNRRVNSILVSQRYGQIVYPAIIEAPIPVRVGYACYRFYQGALCRSGANVYQIVTKREPYSWADYHASSTLLGLSYVPERVFYRKPTYDIHESSDNVLDTLQISGPVGHGIALWRLIDGIANTIFSQECDHSHRAQAGTLGMMYHLTDIRQEHGRPELLGPLNKNDDKKRLIPLHDCGIWQLLQIAVLEQTEGTCGAVLHWKGCIACALQLCEDVGGNLVIC